MAQPTVSMTPQQKAKASGVLATALAADRSKMSPDQLMDLATQLVGFLKLIGLSVKAIRDFLKRNNLPAPPTI